ncbi:SAGA complex subunit spt3 [Astathelohania contejeani]|uniref:SAGA complex subunit spt3 n=1 Tax=Astathelohania contejeani TaxID=164912 RepID=A0ABQ7I0W9_9MICR|nr:SAGA complex subunit spt3 [Thelohania contejeani]
MANIYIYQSEIKAMLYSFGDIKEPKDTTAKYIEDMLKSHIRALIQEAKEIQYVRQGKHLSLEDFCFVLRHDPIKLKRISNFLKFRILKKRLVEKSADTDEIDDAECDEESTSNNEETLDYEWLDQNLDEIDDKEMKSRLIRIDELTKNMSKQEYLEYSECKQASFTFKKSAKFKNFIGIEKIKAYLVDVLGYICHDALQLVALKALELKKENSNKRMKKGKFKPTPNTGLDKTEIEEACRLIILEKGRII